VSRAFRAGGVSAPPIHVIGLRAARLSQIPLGDAELILVAGLGGGLDPRLRVGDLVLDTPVPALPQDLPWHVGPIHSVGSLVTTPADKATLFGQTGALAVEMEQAAVRRAAPPGARVIGLRAISDPADMAIDPAVLTFLDGTGRPRPLVVGTTLLRRPTLIPHLRTLRRNTRLALHNLCAGVAALVPLIARSSIDRKPPV
jgi:hypothetical protein